MLEAAFYLLIVIIAIVLAAGFKRALRNAGYMPGRAGKFMRGYWIVIAAWILYLPVIVWAGVFERFGMFPAIPLFTILPIFIVIAYFHFSGRFNDVIRAFPMPLTIYFQSFRIVVELLILGVYLKGYGPVETTFEGRNFDILAGITAPIVGYLAFSRKLISAKGLLVWNILCLLLLVNIVFIFNSMGLKPEIWGYTSNPIKPEFLDVPYLYIASLYMPAAVFMHIMSIKKLTMKKASI